MYFRFSAAHCTYIWMLANRCYTTVLQWTSEWSLPCGPTFYPGQSLFLLIHVSKYNILLQRYPPRKSSATQLVANLQCLCIWLLVLLGKIFRVFRMVRYWSAHGMWWLSLQKAELDQPWADFNMQAHANALTMFALVARGWKMKMDISDILPAKTCNVGIRILIWILNGCIRFVFGKSLLHPPPFLLGLLYPQLWNRLFYPGTFKTVYFTPWVGFQRRFCYSNGGLLQYQRECYRQNSLCIKN